MAASESETTAEKAVARDHAAAAAAATSNAMVAVSAFVPSESALSHEKRIASAIRLWKMRNAHVTKVVEMKIDKEEVVSGLKRARQRAQSTLCAGASAAADALAEGDEQESGCYDDAWRRVRAVRSVPGARDDANDRDAAAECRHLADAFARMASAYRWERVALAAKKARARDTLDGDSVSAITQRSEFLAHAESSLLARSRRLTKGAYARDNTIAAADATVLPTPGDWRIAARARVFQAATRARAIEPIVNRLKWIGFTHRRVLLLRGVGNADDRCGADETFWIAVTPPDLALDYDNLRRMFDALATQWHVMRDRGEPHGHIADYNIRRHFAEILQRQERLLTPGRAVDDTGEDLNASRGTGASVLTINPTPSAVSDPYAAPPPVRLPVRRYGNEPPPPIVLADEMLEGVDLGVGLQSLAVDAVGARSKGLSMNMTDGSNVASGEHKDGPGSRVAETLLLEEERLAPESTLVDEFDAEKAETQIKGLAKMQLDRIDYLHEEHSRFANRLEKDVTYRKKKAGAVSNNMKPVQAQTAARDAAAASGQLPPRPPGRRATIPPPHVSIMDEARHSFFGPSSELGFGGDAEAALLHVGLLGVQNRNAVQAPREIPQGHGIDFRAIRHAVIQVQELLVLRQTLEAISGMDTEITLDEARELARDGVRIALESGRRRDPTLARPHSAETFMRSSDAEILAQKRFPKRPSSAVVAQRNSSLLPSRGGVSASGRDRPSSAQLQQRIARNLKETHGGVRVTEFGGAAAYKGTVTSAPPRVAFGRGVDAVSAGPVHRN